MYEPSYLEALKHSFKLVWNNKSLWVFGILSALFVSPFGLGGFWGQFTLTSNEASRIDYFPLPAFFQALSHSNPANFVSLVWLLEIILAVFIIVIFISVCAQTSLIINACEYYKKKNHSALSATWNKSYKYFWKILSFDLIRKFILAILLISAASLWVVAPENSFWSSLYLISSFIILVLISFIISSALTYASGYAVIEGKSIWQSLKKGTLLLQKHLLVSLEISLIMMIMDLILAAFVSIIIILSFLPATLVWFIAGLFSSITLFTIALVIGLLTMIILVVLIGGFYNAFNTGTWMYLFMKMHHTSIFSRIGHTLNKIFQR